MIIFLDEDRAYHSWVTHHRSGFVLDGLRQPSKKPFTIHRATCPAVRLSATRRTHWTTGRHLKACSTVTAELMQWAKRERGKESLACTTCTPLESESTTVLPDGAERIPLPRLAKEILEFVLDSALIHLDHDDAEFRVTAGEVARYLHKTIGQISSSVFKLRDSGFFQLMKLRGKTKLSENTLIYPTVLALQTLPIFHRESPQQLANYVNTLQETYS